MACPSSSLAVSGSEGGALCKSRPGESARTTEVRCGICCVLCASSQALAHPHPTPLPTKHGSFRQEGQLGGRGHSSLSSWEIGLEEEMLVTAAVDAAAAR